MPCPRGPAAPAAASTAQPAADPRPAPPAVAAAAAAPSPALVPLPQGAPLLGPLPQQKWPPSALLPAHPGELSAAGVAETWRGCCLAVPAALPCWALQREQQLAQLPPGGTSCTAAGRGWGRAGWKRCHPPAQRKPTRRQDQLKSQLHALGAHACCSKRVWQIGYRPRCQRTRGEWQPKGSIHLNPSHLELAIAVGSSPRHAAQRDGALRRRVDKDCRDLTRAPAVTPGWHCLLPFAAQVAQHRLQALACAQRQLQERVVPGCSHGGGDGAVQRHKLHAQLAAGCLQGGRKQAWTKQCVCSRPPASTPAVMCDSPQLITKCQQPGEQESRQARAQRTWPMLPSSAAPDIPMPLLLRKLCEPPAPPPPQPAPPPLLPAPPQAGRSASAGWLPAVRLLLAGCCEATSPSCAPVWL